jgi:hypothetical protein
MKSFQISVEEGAHESVSFDYDKGSFNSPKKIKKSSSKKPIRVFVDGSFYRCVFNVDELKETLSNFIEEEMSKR